MLPAILDELPEYLLTRHEFPVISWFSCGAASAIATVMAYHKYGPSMEAVYDD